MTTSLSKQLINADLVSKTGDTMTGTLVINKTGSGVEVKTISNVHTFTGYHVKWSNDTLALSFTKNFGTDTISISNTGSTGTIHGGLIFDASGDIRTLKSEPPMVNDLSMVHKKYADTVASEVTPPDTATSEGTRGNIAFTDTHFYVCTATNTWRRVAIGTW